MYFLIIQKLALQPSKDQFVMVRTAAGDYGNLTNPYSQRFDKIN